MKRGDKVNGTGKFVGVARTGTMWVCYGSAKEYRAMCKLFDKNWK